MKTSIVLASLALSLAASPAFAAGAGHDHKPLHGGVVAEASDLDFELVAKADSVALYVRDHGKPATLKGASGKLTLLSGGTRQEAVLAEAGDRLQASGSFAVAPGTKVVAMVQLAGKKPANVRFAIPLSAPMQRHWPLLLLAWLIALAATAAALFIGEVMGMTPCVLCWYQRIAMFPLVAVLGTACYSADRRGAVYALPLSLAGAGLAAYHTLLLAGFIPKAWIPCGAGVSCAEQKLEILNGIPIPWLSLAAFVAIAGLLIVYLRKTRP